MVSLPNASHGEHVSEARPDITQLLQDASHGHRVAFDELFPLIYDELRALAQSKLAMEAAGHTLNATALVHEAYLKLVAQERMEWNSRVHFFAVAAQAMRRILVSHARARQAAKRGKGARGVPLAEASERLSTDPLSDDQADDLTALDEALERLKAFNAQGADVVEYRFFGGMRHGEIAEVLGVSEVTVRRRWAAAKAWLRAELSPTAVANNQTLLVGRTGS